MLFVITLTSEYEPSERKLRVNKTNCECRLLHRITFEARRTNVKPVLARILKPERRLEQTNMQQTIKHSEP